MIDLADRPNPSGWARLLDQALPLLDHVFGGANPIDDRPAWTMGGGTALALRIAHRISDDVDIFVGSHDLRDFTPTRNPHAKSLARGMQFPGNYLRYRLEGGEIDFLPGPLFSSPGYSWETFRGRSIALQTCEEVIVKKVRYRAASFKARDAFDLAAVAQIAPDLGDLLVRETGDRLSTLSTALSRHGSDAMTNANVRPLPGFEDNAVQAIARSASFVEALMASMKRP